MFPGFHLVVERAFVTNLRMRNLIRGKVCFQSIQKLKILTLNVHSQTRKLGSFAICLRGGRPKYINQQNSRLGNSYYPPNIHIPAEMSKKLFQQLSKQATVSKMCFEWGPTTTRISEVLSTEDLRVNVHRDISNPGWAIANIHVNKGAKDPAAKALLQKGNTGAHKTMHQNVASIRYSQTNYDNVAFQQAIEEAKQADDATITIETGESSGSDYVNNGEPSMNSGQEIGNWEYDPGQRTQKYWDGTIWVYYDAVEKREKIWNGVVWQWKA